MAVSAPQTGSWYILPNVFFPEHRALDRRVIVKAMDRWFVYFETEAPAGRARGVPLCLPLIHFRKYARSVS